MQQESLEQIVSKLISLKQEGDFWDFKKEWQTDNKKADLIKDIICFANSIHKRDCYLIFGVNDTYNITGMEQKRWKQADIIDLLSKLKWAEGNIPHISVKTITLNDTLIDVLIDHNSDHVPFYLDADYKCDKFSLRQGVIYSRYKDRNTAWGE
ncbi:MAG: ATP-binding protein, partial [Lentisphaeria bacterium]|nr:ATP-binding protein [Lentisphaeria bacterium]